MQAGIAVGNLASAIGVQSGEAALVAELKAGSETAFALLIAQYHQPIYSVIARSLQDPADAADITQEVFLKVYRGIGSFHGDASLKTWIYRIALHEASNRRRWWSRHKQQELTIDSPLAESEDSGDTLCLSDTLADGGRSPYERAAEHETKARVEAALQKLPGKLPHRRRSTRDRRLRLRRNCRDPEHPYRHREIAASSRTRRPQSHLQQPMAEVAAL